MTTKLKALIATGRISNLPTVWCNCLAGSLLLIHSSNAEFSNHTGNLTLVALILLISSTFIYTGGCFLGDAVDANFDKKHKPKRPIPCGLLKRTTVFSIAIIILVIGLLLPTLFHYIPNTNSHPISPQTRDYGWEQMSIIPFLLLAVILYSIYHKRNPIIGLPLIGLCRFLLCLFAANITAWLANTYTLILMDQPPVEKVRVIEILILPIILYASAVAIYTIAFASVARTESSNSPVNWRNLLRYTMLALPLTVLITNQSFQIETITAFIIYALWLSYSFSFLSKNKGTYVSKCLAGFCLLDACFVAQFGWHWLILCLILFVPALALQKIAPAT